MSSGSMREPSARELDAMSAEDYRRYVARKASVRPVEQLRGMSTRELAERKNNVEEDTTREIVRSSRANGLTHSVPPQLSLRQRQSIADFQKPPATPKSEAQLERERRAAACHALEMSRRKSDEEEKIRQQEEQKARIKAQADAELKAKKLRRVRGELSITEQMMNAEFETFGLNESEIREVMNKLSPADFTDIGCTKAHFYAAEIAAKRDS